MSRMLRTMLVLGVWLPFAGTAWSADLPRTLDVETLRAIPMQHDGRWPPLDTIARDLVEKVTGTQFLHGEDPVLVLLAWTFDPIGWTNEPVISIGSAALRSELELPETQSVYSLNELAKHRPLQLLIAGLARKAPGEKFDPLESKVNDIDDKIMTLRQIMAGGVLHPIPNVGDPLGAWGTIKQASTAGATMKPAIDAWADVRTSFLADDAAAFADASSRFAGALSALPAAHRPDLGRLAIELRYHKLNPYRWAWMVMVVAAMLATVGLFVRRSWFDVLIGVTLTVGFAILTYGLWMRWTIAGRIPASNMFESLLFLSWGMGAIAILAIIVLRHRSVPLTAAIMGAVSLMLADLLPAMDPFIRPIPPVLADTIWMGIHVPIIMVSYSVLALAVLIAHVQVIAMAVLPTRRGMIARLDQVHYWYIHIGVILLIAGIITGSMWGASSWGRYWGWDPKEVWSLVAAMGYLTILHVRVDHDRVRWWGYGVGLLAVVGLAAIVLPKFADLATEGNGKLIAFCGAGVAMGLFLLARGAFATAVKSIVAFWMILMTYLGVNYILGIGLHSYGFGTGAVAQKMIFYGMIDLALIAACTVVYLLRRPRSTTYAAPAVSPPTLGAAT